ncbi:DUF6461 domain-containing protein [Streptomyces bohaiensis]|uniref:SMI1/KNR4 family protein n=1 Tax=Streptomyces bohaiensis TaxID=1431344 RepID=A0ABX1CE11_9ACTN|nr:DUF6461 domain-containing protein [Streptomyces bohaiensis]NJQ16045.1 hypothetical protein [Streptomyces bohaiensis]
MPPDAFGITCVHGHSVGKVLDRLQVTAQAPYPLYTQHEAAQEYVWPAGAPAARVYSCDDWTFLFDVSAHGKLCEPTVVARLSAGGEAVSVWKALDGTTRVCHAQDGSLLADIDAWALHLTSGADPSRMNRALSETGFFRDWDTDEEDDWLVPSAAALLAVEREFEISISPEAVNGALPTVSLQS